MLTYRINSSTRCVDLVAERNRVAHVNDPTPLRSPIHGFAR